MVITNAPRLVEDLYWLLHLGLLTLKDDSPGYPRIAAYRRKDRNELSKIPAKIEGHGVLPGAPNIPTLIAEFADKGGTIFVVDFKSCSRPIQSNREETTQLLENR